MVRLTNLQIKTNQLINYCFYQQSFIEFEVKSLDMTIL